VVVAAAVGLEEVSFYPEVVVVAGVAVGLDLRLDRLVVGLPLMLGLVLKYTKFY